MRENSDYTPTGNTAASQCGDAPAAGAEAILAVAPKSVIFFPRFAMERFLRTSNRQQRTSSHIATRKKNEDPVS